MIHSSESISNFPRQDGWLNRVVRESRCETKGLEEGERGLEGTHHCQKVPKSVLNEWQGRTQWSCQTQVIWHCTAQILLRHVRVR